jgi:quercetin dioxygenase-like cupin family protein
MDLGVEPGLVHWIIVEFDPNAARSMHHTDTLDFDVVLEGSVELGLDDGQHLLEPGDCAVITGVDHSWTAGPDGCRMSVTLIGTPHRSPD